MTNSGHNNGAELSDQHPDPDDAGSVLGDLGLGDSFLPDELSPPVNGAVLDRLARGDLDGEAADAARRLVARFRPWRQAFSDVLTKVNREGGD